MSFKKEIVEVTKRIKELTETFSGRLNQIRNNRNSYKGEGVASQDDCESNLLLANKTKTAAIDLSEDASKIYMVAKELLARTESSVRLGNADSLIKEKGFPKATEALRESILLSDLDLAALRKVMADLGPVVDSINSYVWCLKEDETTWRELTSAKYRKSML